MLRRDGTSSEGAVHSALVLRDDTLLWLLEELRIPGLDEEVLDEVLEAEKDDSVIETVAENSGQVTRSWGKVSIDFRRPLWVLSTVICFIEVDSGKWIVFHGGRISDFRFFLNLGSGW